MTEHVKGAVNNAEGNVKEGVGKLTGDKKLEAKGDVQQVQGKAQNGLGDIEDAVRKTSRS
jgi:uncharacterized protein YjbJ (UPF0337 family)